MIIFNKKPIKDVQKYKFNISGANIINDLFQIYPKNIPFSF